MRKKDEMEQKIANKAVKITWFVTILALFVIGGIQRFMNEGQSNIFMLIAILSTTLLISLEQYYLAKMNEDNRFKKYVLVVLILSAILLSLGWLLSQ